MKRLRFIFGLHGVSRPQAARFLAALLLLVFVYAGGTGVAEAQTVTTLRLNEVESNGGVPDDWIEVTNIGNASINISGWKVKDNDDAHPFFVFPNGSVILPGAYLAVDVAGSFGLGSTDIVRIFTPEEVEYERFGWSDVHAATTYGRCPNGTGAFTTTTSPTKGTANDCSSPVRFNEVESNGGVPGDWVEIKNPLTATVSLAGFSFKDNDDLHNYVIPFGTTIAAGGYLVLNQADFGFSLDANDSVRLIDIFGALVDSFSWTSEATTSYGKCPTDIGTFITTLEPTKGTANSCVPWPGGPNVQTVDGTNVFGGNMSGLVFEASSVSSPAVLWAVRNGPETLFRLVFDGVNWTPDPANGWVAGKTLLYPGGTGRPDSEGVTFAGGNSSNGIYVATERDNSINTISRNSILRFDPSDLGTTLNATHEWNLTADLPATGANLGAEAIAWIPDSYLTSSNFFDASKGHAYNPAEYPNHASGLFFVGLEANGNIYAYALDHSPGGAFTRIATISSGFTGVMDLQFDTLLGDFWAVCDDTCQGLSAVLRIDGAGKFTVGGAFLRPAAMPNMNNEGFAVTPVSECVTGFRPVFWADDGQTANHALRRGSLPCTKFLNFPDAIAPKPAPTAAPVPDGAGWNLGPVMVTWNWTDNLGGSGIDNAQCTTSSVSSGVGAILLSATCKDLSGNTGHAEHTVKVYSISESIDILLALGEIANDGVANSLQAKLGKNPNQLHAFLHELDAQHGKKISNEAYELLKTLALD